MAASEARDAWQRTANRCFVQEDAKRVPNMTMHDIPISNDSPFSRSPSHPNASPSSKWWLQLQPHYKYQMDLMEVDLQSYEDVDQTSLAESSFDVKLACEEDVFYSFEVSKKSDEISFDSGSSWVGVEKNTPWWRLADTDELSLAVAQRSHDLLENCDLPMPQNTHLRKDLKCIDEITTQLPVTVRKADYESNHSFFSPKLRMHSKALSDRQSLKMHATDEGKRDAQLLDALRHSQTRAREAEAAAKQACCEKEHVVKLLFRQASELFAYKQLLQLLQMENMYLQFINSERPSASSLFSESRCRTPGTRKRQTKSSRGKQAKKARYGFDVGRYAIVIALGLGIIGAGLLFGWMLPIW